MKNNLPFCYALGFDRTQKALLITFNKGFIPEMNKLLSHTHPFIQELVSTIQKPYHFEGFIGIGTRFGFEEQWIVSGQTQSTITCSFRLSPIKQQSEQNCSFCNNDGSDCFSCGGTGKTLELVSNTYLSSGLKTLYCLTTFFHTKLRKYDECNTSIQAYIPQILHIMISEKNTVRDIDGWICKSVLPWIKQATKEERDLITLCMLEVHEYLTLDKNIPRSFSISHHETKFGLDIPGNACGAGTYDAQKSSLWKTGEEIGSHNVHTIAQQMTLIAGFACLSELVDAWIAQKQNRDVK